MKKSGKLKKAGMISAESTIDKVVLVGTYKKGQLEWIEKSGIYNYPIKDDDKMPPEAFGKIVELWLYLGKKGERTVKTAAFRGIMSREEFLAEFPDYPKGKGKPHSDRYAVFSVKDKEENRYSKLKAQGLPDDMGVIVRFDDFKARTPVISKAIKAYQDGGEFGNLLDYLPSEIASLPRNQLRVYESWVQMDFWDDCQTGYNVSSVDLGKEIFKRAKESGRLTCVEICAGAGGQALGLENAGFEHVALVEYESEYCAVLRKNNPSWNVICGDVREFDGSPYVGVDLLAGGVPCPPFSVASKQLGKDDERDLFPEAIRLISEIKPKAVMLENVRGLLDSKFEEYRTSILRRIDELGYDVQIKLLHASDYGVPQIRPRVVIIGIKKELQKKFQYPAAFKDPAPTVGDAIGDLMAANGWNGVEAWKRQANTVAPTIVGGSKKHGGPDLGPTRARRAWAALAVDGSGVANTAPAYDFVGNPKLTKEMIAVIQGFPRNWNFGKKKTAACRMIGNAFPPPVAMAVGQQIMRCLNDEK